MAYSPLSTLSVLACALASFYRRRRVSLTMGSTLFRTDGSVFCAVSPVPLPWLESFTLWRTLLSQGAGSKPRLRAFMAAVAALWNAVRRFSRGAPTEAERPGAVEERARTGVGGARPGKTSLTGSTWSVPSLDGLGRPVLILACCQLGGLSVYRLPSSSTSAYACPL